MPLADTMAAFVAGLKPDTIPETILDGARDRLLDALSTSLAAREVPTTLAVLFAVRASGAAGGACTVLPTGNRASAQDAAFVNGTAVHAILFEDYHLTAADHPGASVVPAAIAAAESGEHLRGRPATIGDLLVAIVAGYEVQVRLGLIGAEGIRSRGLRTTGILGTVGAAAAAASAFGLPADRAEAAISMGANMASGFLEGYAHGTMEPYIHAGISARNGVLAGYLGYGGVRTAPVTFEGRSGYLAVFGDMAPAEHDFPAEWGLPRVTCKPYPLSGGKTSTVDSALALVAQGVRGEDVESGLVRLPTRIKLFPGSDHPGPFTNMNEAQDSTQFVTAAALLGRPMKALKTVMDDYADPDIHDLARRIEVVGEENRIVDGKIVATVEVTLRDGRTLVSTVDASADHLPTVAAMADKLRLLAAGAWDADRTERVIDLVVGDPSAPLELLSAAMRGHG
jgi:2-methylcitrate dehydratase PrpD